MGHIILIDVGNTTTTVGLGRDEHVTRSKQLPGHQRSNEIRQALQALVGESKADGAIISSVVPAETELWIKEVSRLSKQAPLLLDYRMKLGVGIAYPKPSSIGADRLANAAGVAMKYRAPIIVVDFGTALTFDVISADREYVGGVIAPGLPFMTEYLAEKTALLPKIRLKGSIGSMGTSTVEAMRIGAKVGYRGMVREIVGFLKQGLGCRRLTLCATGGYAQWALEGIGMPFVHDADITLYGLLVIYRLNVEA